MTKNSGHANLIKNIVRRLTVFSSRTETGKMNTIDLIKSRTSYRGPYLSTKVPREHLKLIMEAGLAAPSGCNKQTTRLIAVDDEETLAKLRVLNTFKSFKF